MKIDVLDSGFVRLVDMMGDDNRVLDAARVSTGTSSKGEEKDKKLIDYLMKNNHHTPFEKIVFEWHIKCPIFVARQWMRHRIGSFNEASARYRKIEFDPYIPEIWRKQAKKNTQGSSNERFTKKEENNFDVDLRKFYTLANALYDKYIDAGVARELARIILPMGTHTEFYWTVNFRSYMNFSTLRRHSDAQFEIREFANAMKEILESMDNITMTLSAYQNYG